MLKQAEQDHIWKHYQNLARDSLARFEHPSACVCGGERCVPGTRVLNIGVGSGYLEKLLADRAWRFVRSIHAGESITRLQVELNMEERAKHGYSQDIPFNVGYFDRDHRYAPGRAKRGRVVRGRAREA